MPLADLSRQHRSRFRTKPSGPPTALSAEAYFRSLQAAIDAEVAQKRLPAFSIALVDSNQVLWSSGTASKDPKARDSSKAAATTGSAIDEQTIYRVGSVTKLFTDVAIMQLVEQSKLDLDEPIEKYLPEFQPHNPFGGKLTLRQLMSHRAGLVREPPVGHYFDPSEPSLWATVQSLNQTALVYAPDTRTKYSNAGITVVGAVLEKMSGQSFDQQIINHVLKPLDMRSSMFQVDDVAKARLAPATMWTLEGRRFPAPQFDLGTAPAGNLYSTVADLSKFMRCLLRHGQISDQTEPKQLLKPDTLEQMLTPPRTQTALRRVLR